MDKSVGIKRPDTGFMRSKPFWLIVGTRETNFIQDLTAIMRTVRFIVLLGVMGIILPGVSSAADTGVNGPPLAYVDTVPSMDSVRTLDRDRVPFEKGERIKLRATYLGITAGYITMTVNNDTVAGRPLYRLVLNAETGGFVDYIYSLQDRFVSFLDRRGLFSWGYNYHQIHNGNRQTRTVRYFHREGFFTENEKRRGKIKRYTQDLLSTMYYIRVKELNDGDTVSFPLQTGDEYYDVTLNVDEDARVATKNGWKNAYELAPVLRKSEHKEMAQDHVESISGIRIWLSHDDRKIPLKISFPATFGHLNAYLEDYREGPEVNSAGEN